MAHTETMLESKEIFNGRVIRVTVDKVQLEDGTTSTREIVHHHGGAAVGLRVVQSGGGEDAQGQQNEKSRQAGKNSIFFHRKLPILML